jgi:hypothetical protein
MIKVRPFNWRRFSLRTLFVLTTLVCLAAGMWSAIVNPYRVQLQSLAAVNRLHGTVVEETPDRPAWHRWLVTSFLGKDAYFHVTFVDLAGCQVDDSAARSLSGLGFLHKLNLDNTQITDEGAAVLRSMPLLQELSLRFTKVGDGAATCLASAPSLSIVYLTGTQTSDAAINTLAENRNLAQLYIRWTKITNAGATKLAAALPKCAVNYHALAE